MYIENMEQREKFIVHATKLVDELINDPQHMNDAHIISDGEAVHDTREDYPIGCGFLPLFTDRVKATALTTYDYMQGSGYTNFLGFDYTQEIEELRKECDEQFFNQYKEDINTAGYADMQAFLQSLYDGEEYALQHEYYDYELEFMGMFEACGNIIVSLHASSIFFKGEEDPIVKIDIGKTCEKDLTLTAFLKLDYSGFVALFDGEESEVAA